nr:FtsX-like permease family protein [Puia sp.]
IIGTVVVYRQIQYAKDRPTGYDRGGLISVPINTDELGQHLSAVSDDVLKTGVVSHIAESSQQVTGFNNNNQLDWRGKKPDQDAIFFRNVNVSADYGKTVGWKLVAGRDFSDAYGTDSSAMILNEAAVKIIGIKNVVGETMKFFGRDRVVVGVVKDMLTNSPYEQIEPALFIRDPYFYCMIIRIKPGLNMHRAVAALEPVFKKYNPSSPFIYSFPDDDYARKFDAEERIGSLATFFAVLAIFISCLGLFGLASFVAEQRTKEIGVRKVLGASVLQLWRLLSGEFVRLVLISLTIAMPLAWYLMHSWLQHYDYRTPISAWIFVASGGAALAITLLTVSFQSVKAALANPVRSLRSE